MKKIIITFLVVRFCEKVLSDWEKYLDDNDELVELKDVLVAGIIKNLPVINKILW